jgi:hypothetical protein
MRAEFPIGNLSKEPGTIGRTSLTMSLQLDTMKVGVLTGVNINPKRRLYGSSHRRIGINGTYDVLLGDFPEATNQLFGSAVSLTNDAIQK